MNQVVNPCKSYFGTRLCQCNASCHWCASLSAPKLQSREASVGCNILGHHRDIQQTRQFFSKSKGSDIWHRVAIKLLSKTCLFKVQNRESQIYILFSAVNMVCTAFEPSICFGIDPRMYTASFQQDSLPRAMMVVLCAMTRCGCFA